MTTSQHQTPAIQSSSSPLHRHSTTDYSVSSLLERSKPSVKVSNHGSEQLTSGTVRSRLSFVNRLLRQPPDSVGPSSSAVSSYYDALRSAFHRIHQTPPATRCVPAMKHTTSSRRPHPFLSRGRASPVSVAQARGVAVNPFSSAVSRTDSLRGRFPQLTDKFPLSGDGLLQISRRAATGRDGSGVHTETGSSVDERQGCGRRISAFETIHEMRQVDAVGVVDDCKNASIVDLETAAAAAAMRASGGVTDVYDNEGIRANVHLEHQELWNKFNSLGTEMVITKSGR